MKAFFFAAALLTLGACDREQTALNRQVKALEAEQGGKSAQSYPGAPMTTNPPAAPLGMNVERDLYTRKADPAKHSDAQIHAMVQEALASEASTDGLDRIDIRVQGGIVTLSGHVSNNGELTEVLEEAAKVIGKERVVNRLQIVK